MTPAVISIGVITPHGAAGPEAEWAQMAGGQVAAATARIPAPGGSPDDPGVPPSSASGLRALTTLDVLDAAVAGLAPLRIDAIGYASTSTGYALGYDAEVELLARLARRWKVPAESTSAAAASALHELGILRLAVIHPPWFAPDLHRLGAKYFAERGFDLVAAELAVDLPADPDRIEPGDVIAWVSANVPDRAQAVFLGGNGFRAVAAVGRLEAALGRPVLTSNQVLLWSLLRRTGGSIDVSGYGSLFRAD